MDDNIELIDVVIIGAGFTGLSAAKYFSSKSIKTLIIEGRSRVGGRTLSHKITDQQWIIDLGGQWIGPDQHRILSFIKEYNLDLIEQTWHHHQPNFLGENLGLIPLNNKQIENIIEINSQWDHMALELSSVECALEYHKSFQWSIISVQQFIEEHPLANQDLRIQQELKLQILTLTACHSNKLSLLYWLILIRSIPRGLTALDDGINGAQHYKISHGSQNVCFEMSKTENIRLNDPVESINYELHDNILIKMLSGYKIKCRRLLLAFSPTLLSTINFLPSLSLTNNCPMIMGQCIKTVFIYSKPFWRNISINQTDQQGPCSNIFESNNPHALIGLILGDDAVFWSDKNEDELIQAIIKQYEILYNMNEIPMNTFVQYWTKENFSKGCYAAVYPPSSSSTWIDRRKALVDKRIWLASTEMALEWVGYIEGAIEAGQRFAQEISNSF
ncbi:unnamed protein product [Adineta steineri]|uniref:Amine oxidase n=2 Tax=Adineta steineri TaxID=433720 RepID=A0A816C7N6_9BILA|nr:unnamed protein product [Adineta steineri]CAF1618078.1 unnamed protein product [Adineta steineri]